MTPYRHQVLQRRLARHREGLRDIHAQLVDAHAGSNHDGWACCTCPMAQSIRRLADALRGLDL